MIDHVNTTCVLYKMLRGRRSFIFHLCDFGPLHSSPAFSVAPECRKSRQIDGSFVVFCMPAAAGVGLLSFMESVHFFVFPSVTVGTTSEVTSPVSGRALLNSIPTYFMAQSP